MLFPPVQDGRIAKCINEPKKMVAEPFTPSTSRVINGHKMKSTLLEAIIRIRLDIVSGTTLVAPPDPEHPRPPISVGSRLNSISHIDIIESMGLLESLIIIRLFSAVHGFAIDVKNRIADLINLQHKTGIAPVGTSTNDNSQDPTEKKKFCEGSEMRCNLESIKLIEDSLLLLLGDNQVPEALDLQEDIVRNSGVKTAHLMSAVLSIIDIPRRWVEHAIGKLDEEEAKIAEQTQSSAKSGISSKLGVTKGVGGIDILAFMIALFTLPEDELISLLTDEQFENLKLEFPDNFFKDFNPISGGQRKAINQVAIRAYDVYQFFLYAFVSSGGKFVHPLQN
jgi:hypothetical protein